MLAANYYFTLPFQFHTFLEIIMNKNNTPLCFEDQCGSVGCDFYPEDTTITCSGNISISWSFNITWPDPPSPPSPPSSGLIQDPVDDPPVSTGGGGPAPVPPSSGLIQDPVDDPPISSDGWGPAPVPPSSGLIQDPVDDPPTSSDGWGPAPVPDSRSSSPIRR